ncbi:MAG TPA: hypothetical protein VHP83_27020 [Aggregatilineaceae bacterium]|nr:hypothetical protein [Aggregatilineaceae bacterium]
MYRKPFQADHEYLGQTLIDFELAAGDAAHVCFQQHGLTNLSPDTWYPASTFIAAIRDMPKLDLVSVGRRQAELTDLPDYLSLLEVFDEMNQLYLRRNRGSDVGDIQCEVLGPTHIALIFRVPQPDDLWYGICCGYVRRFTARNAYCKVYYDPDLPRCDQGGDVTVIHVEW